MTEEKKMNPNELVEPPETPAYSIGENDGRIQVKVDGGKFMDSIYVYKEFTLKEEDGKKSIFVPTDVLSMVVNGVSRDAMQLEHQTPDIMDEFDATVATPIAIELINIAQQPVE